MGFIKAEKAFTKQIIASMALATASLAAPLHAHAESREFIRPKSSLFQLYRTWQARSTEAGPTIKALIEPTNAPADLTARKAQKKPRGLLPATGATKPTSNEEITDAEILAQDKSSLNDPFEPINRVVFEINEALDAIIFTPVSSAYRFVTPQPVRTGISNVVANAKAPVTLVNDLLQGKPEQAQKTVVRFLINSTAGFGGFVDAAEAGGIPKHTEDFGQTLAVWGIGAGPYVVLPVLGPMTPRHMVGRVADTAATPTTWLLADFGLLERSTPTMAQLITTHEGIMDDANNLRKSAPDFYAAVRGIYRQNRKDAIADGKVDDDASLPEIPDE